MTRVTSLPGAGIPYASCGSRVGLSRVPWMTVSVLIWWRVIGCPHSVQDSVELCSPMDAWCPLGPTASSRAELEPAAKVEVACSPERRRQSIDECGGEKSHGPMVAPASRCLSAAMPAIKAVPLSAQLQLIAIHQVGGEHPATLSLVVELDAVSDPKGVVAANLAGIEALIDGVGPPINANLAVSNRPHGPSCLVGPTATSNKHHHGETRRHATQTHRNSLPDRLRIPADLGQSVREVPGNLKCPITNAVAASRAPHRLPEHLSIAAVSSLDLDPVHHDHEARPLL